LLHPTWGDTGIKIKVAGPLSAKWLDSVTKFLESEQTTEDKSKLLTSVIIGWDEESFGGPFSIEARDKLFEDDANYWILVQVDVQMAKIKDFYPKKEMPLSEPQQDTSN
jgi:hypothetical protein